MIKKSPTLANGWSKKMVTATIRLGRRDWKIHQRWISVLYIKRKVTVLFIIIGRRGSFSFISRTRWWWRLKSGASRAVTAQRRNKNTHDSYQKKKNVRFGRSYLRRVCIEDGDNFLPNISIGFCPWLNDRAPPDFHSPAIGRLTLCLVNRELLVSLLNIE